MRITGQTRIMFILADAVGHIVGSDVLNQAFEREGLDVAVSPLSIAPEDLEMAVQTIRRLKNVIGFGVTIPHKTEIARYLDDVTPEAQAMGAVNFVRRFPDGRLLGHNVDGAGFVAGLRAEGIEAKGKRILQAGAGGVGKAIAHAVAAEGCASITLVNRDLQKAARLGGELSNRFPGVRVNALAGFDGLQADQFDMIVNATALGMKEGDPLPVPERLIVPEAVVAEVVMQPPMTKLLETAATKGCKTIPGKAMMEPQPALVAEFLELL